MLLPSLVKLVVAAALAALALPLAASAQGGGGGIVLSDAPCASVVLKGPGGPVQNKGPITLSYNVSSCYVGAETVTVSVTAVFTSVRPDTGTCVSPAMTWTAITLALKPGDTKGFSTQQPSDSGVNLCPIGTSMWEDYTVSVVNADDGSLLAQSVDRIYLTNRF